MQWTAAVAATPPWCIIPNQTLVLWPNRKHGGLEVHDRRLALYWLHFSLTGGSAKGATIFTVPQLGTPARPDRLRELFHRFLSDFGAGDDWKSRPLNDPRADLLLLQILMLETTLTLKEIAFRRGFDDEGYFCRVFRKNEGVNPTVFRNTRLKLPINVI